MLKSIIIRVDATRQMGHGHLMRCLALAQACRNVGETPVFLSNCDSGALCSRINDEGFNFILFDQIHPNPFDLENTLRILNQYEAGWLILDGYHFDSNFQKKIRESGYRLLVIDDLAESQEYYADILLNQNIYANQLSYKCNSDATLLLGTNYALLRKEFSNKIDSKHKIPKLAKKILVTMGGSDPNNVTLKVLQAIAQADIEGLEVVALVGQSNSHKELLEKEALVFSQRPILVDNPANILNWMEWADIAISGGGSTCYELALMGLPSLIIVLAENQRMVASNLEASGISINLGWHENITPLAIANSLYEVAHSLQTRVEMSKRGRNLVDGNGASRVIQWLQARTLTLRAAQDADCRMIYEWANNKVTRSVSFSTDLISWKDHQRWYKAKLADNNNLIFIALDPNLSPAGMVRYQLDETEAIVSLNLAPLQRGKGYGSKILLLASKKIFQDTQVTLIHAYIKPDNTPSIHVFTKAGFVQKDIVDFQGKQACHFILCEDMP